MQPGQTLLPLGEFVHARKHLEQGLTLYNPEQHRSHAFLHGGYDPGVACWSYMAWALWVSGVIGPSAQEYPSGVHQAQELSHPVVWLLPLPCCFAPSAPPRDAVDPRTVEPLITLSHEQGFPIYLAWGTILKGGR
jgi:hypothetical protein